MAGPIALRATVTGEGTARPGCWPARPGRTGRPACCSSCGRLDPARRHLGAAGRCPGQPRVRGWRRAARGGRGVCRATGRGAHPWPARRRSRRLVLPDPGGRRGPRVRVSGRPAGRHRRWPGCRWIEVGVAAAASWVRRGLAGHPRGGRAGDDHRGCGQRDGLAGRRLVAGPGRRGGPAARRAGRRWRPAASPRCRRAAAGPWTAGSRGTSWCWRGRPGRPCRSWPDRDGVQVVAAPGSGDDTDRRAGRPACRGRRFVVTADRELRRRCVAAGAQR